MSAHLTARSSAHLTARLQKEKKDLVSALQAETLPSLKNPSIRAQVLQSIALPRGAKAKTPLLEKKRQLEAKLVVIRRVSTSVTADGEGLDAAEQKATGEAEKAWASAYGGEANNQRAASLSPRLEAIQRKMDHLLSMLKAKPDPDNRGFLDGLPDGLKFLQVCPVDRPVDRPVDCPIHCPFDRPVHSSLIFPPPRPTCRRKCRSANSSSNSGSRPSISTMIRWRLSQQQSRKLPPTARL